MSSQMKKKGKKRQAQPTINENEDEMSVSEHSSEGDDGSNDSDDNDVEMETLKNIDVEFEAVTPNEADFHGIKQLLLRTFVMLHIDVSDMSDLIISQNKIGSTIKIVEDEDDEVYGIVTILNMKKYQLKLVEKTKKVKDKTCIKELKKELRAKCKSNSKTTMKQFEQIMNNKTVGYMVNERFINLPPQIALPFHTSLREETEEFVKEEPTSDMDYILLIAKTLRPTTAPVKPGTGESSSSKHSAKKKKTKQMQPLRSEKETDYTNFEEEFFHEAAELSFSYCVTQATGLAVGGDWDFTDQPMKSYRTVMLIPKTKWKNILSKIAVMVG